MPRQSKNSKLEDSLAGEVEEEFGEEETVEITEPVAVSSKPKKPHKFGDCMWRRHEYCKVTLEDGTKCECDCGEGHGSKYQPADLDTPLNRIFRKIVEANKAGKMYSESEEYLAAEAEDALTLDVQEPLEVIPVVVDPDETESLEELEMKRA